MMGSTSLEVSGNINGGCGIVGGGFFCSSYQEGGGSSSLVLDRERGELIMVPPHTPHVKNTIIAKKGVVWLIERVVLGGVRALIALKNHIEAERREDQLLPFQPPQPSSPCYNQGKLMLEENDNLVLTPFEKNLDVWRQLWRVLERSDLLVMVVDARDPLFYRCPDLEIYAQEIDEHKRTMLLINKAELLPITIRKRWASFFQKHDILYVFWSAKVASTTTLEGKGSNNYLMEQNHVQGSLQDAETKIYSRGELLACLQGEAQAIAQKRNLSKKDAKCGRSWKNGECTQAAKQVIVGFVGYPNVGKSSTINALVGEKRTGVTSRPGKTKHFQTLIISDELMLCDCPGLVFPSFSSSRYEMIASGVLPIDRMTEHREAVQVVANHVTRDTLESIYNILLPKPKPYEPQSRPPLASELLRAYCSSRGYVAASGLPDETRAARQILKDYIDGKVPHFAMPPGEEDDDDDVGFQNASLYSDSVESNDAESSIEDGDIAGKPDANDLLDDLKSFDIASGMAPTGGTAKKKKPIGSHKHHKKPQRKKDRSWRVGNDGGDGMPVVRVFQKSAVKAAY